MSTQTLTPKDHAEEVALFRSQIIGPLTRQLLQHGELAGELEALSYKLFVLLESIAPEPFPFRLWSAGTTRLGREE